MLAVEGSIVTVSFTVQTRNPVALPNVTVPKAESQWFRGPTQIGDLGLVVPSDASLGGISGLGTGTGVFGVLVPNLSALVWVPVGNVSWAMDDPNAALINGPNGVILRTQDKTSQLKVSETGIVFTIPAGKSITLSTLPTSAAGLAPGSLWNNGGVVNVV